MPPQKEKQGSDSKRDNNEDKIASSKVPRKSTYMEPTGKVKKSLQEKF